MLRSESADVRSSKSNAESIVGAPNDRRDAADVPHCRPAIRRAASQSKREEDVAVSVESDAGFLQQRPWHLTAGVMVDGSDRDGIEDILQ